MVLRIICNIITVAACLVSIIVPIINMIRFPGALMKRLKKIMPCYDNDREFLSFVGSFSADDTRVVRERRNYFYKFVVINMIVNIICFIIGVVACYFDGVPIKEDDILFIVYFVSAGVFIFINAVYYIAQIKKFKLHLRPNEELFRYMRYGDDIKFNSIALLCIAAIFVGGSFVTTTHVIMTWLGL